MNNQKMTVYDAVLMLRDFGFLPYYGHEYNHEYRCDYIPEYEIYIYEGYNLKYGFSVYVKIIDVRIGKKRKFNEYWNLQELEDGLKNLLEFKRIR